MKKKIYGDSDPLYTIKKGYDENTRMLMFHSTPIEAELLQEAIDLIGEYNEFNPKKVGKVLTETFKNGVRYVIGREFSVAIYVIPIQPYLFWAEDLKKLQKAGKIDEVAVTNEGRLRLWWD